VGASFSGPHARVGSGLPLTRDQEPELTLKLVAATGAPVLTRELTGLVPLMGSVGLELTAVMHPLAGQRDLIGALHLAY